MNIRSKLTLKFTLICTIILFFASSAVLFFSDNYRKQEFNMRLKEKALATARLLIEVKEVDSDLLRIIGRNSPTLVNEKVVIYNYLNEEVFDNNEEEPLEVTKEMLNAIRLNGELSFIRGNKEILGIAYSDRYNRFVVVASAYDKYGMSKMRNLRIILLIVMLSSIVVSLLAGYFYSGQALAPISKIVTEVDQITVTSLNKRLGTGNGTDEIAQLAITFNMMLARLEAAFEMQRSFVSNASHELRTPLTAITGQLEVILLKERENKEYITVLNSVLEDIRSLNRLTNGLLDLAQVNVDESVLTLKEFRIDELLWNCAADICKRQSSYKVNIEFENMPEEEKQLMIWGNEQLLKVAINNLMDNACKYSHSKEVEVLIGISVSDIKITFKDNGIGIDDKELQNIFQPFYRASNAMSYKGHGLGLSLTEKIIRIHKGQIHIHSALNKGTSIEITLPSVPAVSDRKELRTASSIA